uniref:SEA domain-containing protein n=1 Tax=Meleagris gallopavo TaxID=9103 RepID=A0A803YFM7_MELGA
MGRCMFFTVLLCLVVSLSAAQIPATTGSSTAIATVLTAPTTTTTGSSTTITTVLTTGNTFTTTKTTDTASSSATPDSSSTATVETSTTSTTTPTEELCKSSPCGGKLSTCVPLNTTYTCQCPYEFYYYNNNCHRGKVFPGIITLAQMLSSDIHDVNSVEYEKMFQNLTQFFKQAFENMTDYRQTIIVKADYTGEDTRTRSGNPATVTVMNIFTENTTETDAKVGEAITRALTISSYVSAYTNTTQCAVFPCDDATTTCEDGPYPVCVCKANFAKTQWDTYSCSDCVNCTAEENKFCDRRSDIPDCKCMDNFKKRVKNV